jgi:hypothetical protein
MVLCAVVHGFNAVLGFFTPTIRRLLVDIWSDTVDKLYELRQQQYLIISQSAILSRVVQHKIHLIIIIITLYATHILFSLFYLN